MTDDDLKAIATYLKDLAVGAINGLDRQQAESRLLLGGIGVEDGHRRGWTPPAGVPTGPRSKCRHAIAGSSSHHASLPCGPAAVLRYPYWHPRARRRLLSPVSSPVAASDDSVPVKPTDRGNRAAHALVLSSRP
jgi:hypothetical protein